MGVGWLSFVFLCLTCLQSISSASPLINGETKGEVGGVVSGSNPSGNDETTFTPTNSFNLERSSNSLGAPASSDPRTQESSSSVEEGSVVKGLQIAKRDKEEEADSANGKSPIPFLFKKSPKGSGNGEESRVFGNEFEFSEFPPLVGRMDDSSSRLGAGQRQRRSSYFPEDEMVESGRDEAENREAFLRLINRLYGAGGLGEDKAYLLLNRGGEPLRGGINREIQFGDETGGDQEVDEDDDDVDDGSPFVYKPISLMSSTAGGDSSAGRIHLNGVPSSSHGGLYVTSHQQAQNKPGLLHLSQLGATYPLSVVRPGGVNREMMMGLRDYTPDETDGGNNEWMEDAIPLGASSMKSRRSDGNSVFTFNPVKSHFRRINRIPLDNYGDDAVGRYRPLLGVRKRRSSPSLHYM